MTGVSQATPATSDVVTLCGTFTTADVDNATTMLVINWTNSGVILDGDCSAQGNLSQAILNGGGSHNRAFDSGSGGAAVVTIRNVAITGFDEYGILGQNTASDNWTLRNIDCDGSLLVNQCIRNLSAGATGWVIDDSTFTNCYDDCIWSTNPMTVENNTAVEWSTGVATGDFVQGTGDCDGWVITGNTGQSSRDIKQGILVNTCSGAANVTATDNTIIKIGQSTDTSIGFVPLFVQAGSGTLTAKRNYLSGGRTNLFVGDGVSLLAEGNVLGPSTTTNMHCGTSTVACTVRHNTINGGTVALEMASAGAGGSAINNALVGTVGINRGASGVETNNTIIATTPCQSGGSTTACDASDDTDNTTMGWVSGFSPTTAAGYRLAATSPLRRVGKELNLGNVQDYGNRAFLHPPSIGAWEVGSGDVITNNTRATAAARTNRN